METGGYKGRSRMVSKEELHGMISKHLGISQIICEYGMSELSSQAYDSAAGVTGPAGSAVRQFHMPPWARVRIISPETGTEVQPGETGLVQIFDLANVRSVAAIQTEDLAVRGTGGFALVGRAERSEARGCSLMTP